MTVTYSDASFKGLLFRWRGSIWKSIWKEFLVFVSLYAAINVSYRNAMTPYQRAVFEDLVNHVRDWPQQIPMHFLLGFYVNYVVNRWWSQLLSIAWPDKFCLFITGLIPGMDDENKMIRRTLTRWVNLHCVLVWRELCVKIKKRFPTDDHLVKSGLMTDQELQIYKNTTEVHGRWFGPMVWCANLLQKCKKEEKISDAALRKLLDELYAIRQSNGMLVLYDWINAPLRYTQVVTLAVYGYFLLSLIGRQELRDSSDVRVRVSIYLPLITLLQFLFYVGWLKVAEEYRIPLGEDDDDFDMNYILDRDMHVSFMIVDELAAQEPELVRDKFWDNRYPRLPHTIASYFVKDSIPKWRLAKYRVPDAVAELLPVFDHHVDHVPWPKGQEPELVRDKFWDNRYPRLPHIIASYFVKDSIPKWRLAKYRVPDAVAELLPVFDHHVDHVPWPKGQVHATLLKADSVPMIDATILGEAASLVQTQGV